MEPMAFCMNSSFSTRSLRSLTTTMPPTMSECPLMYLVTECTTRSMPRSSGRCTNGEAKVLSTTVRTLALLADLRDLRQVGDLEQRVGRRFDPDHFRVRLQSPSPESRSRWSRRSRLCSPIERLRTCSNRRQAAVQVVRGHDVAARIQQFQHCGGRRQSRTRTRKPECRLRGRRCSARKRGASDSGCAHTRSRCARRANCCLKVEVAKIGVITAPVVGSGDLAGVDGAGGETMLVHFLHPNLLCSSYLVHQCAVLRRWLRTSMRVIRP